MNARRQSQRAAYEFLLEHYQTQEPFTIQQFSDATGWIGRTLDTYRTKQFKAFFENVAVDQYRVSDSFAKFISWPRFKAHVTQTRRVVTGYDPTSYEVLIYDFLMPLTNEEYLRTTLDSLFYRDKILARLRTSGLEKLAEYFPRRDGIDDEEFTRDILTFISKRFVGYSISHVDGRFRSGDLMTREQAAQHELRGQRYLIDETTAVARFIFPYKDNAEMEAIQYLFEVLFIRSIIQLVNGEEQIWMVQSGSPASHLRIWQAQIEED